MARDFIRKGKVENSLIIDELELEDYGFSSQELH